VSRPFASKNSYLRKGNFKKSGKKFHSKKKYNVFRPSKAAPQKQITLTCPKISRLQMFPDVYRATGHTAIVQSVSLSTSATNSVYQIQLITNGIHNNFGTMTNQSGTVGAVGSTVPSGISYLLGDSNASSGNAGGNAPYISYRVTNQTIKVTWMPSDILNIVTTQPFGCASMVVVNFSNFGLINNYLTSPQNLTEQMYAKHKIYPSFSTGAPQTITNSCTTLQLWGDRYKSNIEDPAFAGTYNTSPTNETFCIITFTTLGANSVNYALNGSFIIDQWCDYEFFGRNSMLANVPS
jgi:hypothetical protein